MIQCSRQAYIPTLILTHTHTHVLDSAPPRKLRISGSLLNPQQKIIRSRALLFLPPKPQPVNYCVMNRAPRRYTSRLTAPGQNNGSHAGGGGRGWPRRLCAKNTPDSFVAAAATAPTLSELFITSCPWERMQADREPDWSPNINHISSDQWLTAWRRKLNKSSRWVYNPRSSVCLSVSKITQKLTGWFWWTLVEKWSLGRGRSRYGVMVRLHGFVFTFVDIVRDKASWPRWRCVLSEVKCT